MEPLEFVAQVCIIPIIQLFSAIIVAVLRYFLEKGGQHASQPSASNPTGSQTPMSGALPVSPGASPVIPWPARVLLRGGMIVTYALAWFFTMLVMLDVLRPVAYFVENLLYEAQGDPAVGEMFFEFFQVVSIGTIGDACAFVGAAIVGLLAVAIVQGLISVLFWILDMRP